MKAIKKILKNTAILFLLLGVANSLKSQRFMLMRQDLIIPVPVLPGLLQKKICKMLFFWLSAQIKYGLRRVLIYPHTIPLQMQLLPITVIKHLL